MNFYSLPSMKLTSSLTWNSNSPPYPLDYSLSGSGSEVGLLMCCAGWAEVEHPDGSGNVVLESGDAVPPLLSPDGTIAAASNQPTSIPPGWCCVQANIYNNGTLTTAVSALPVGWIDDNDLLASDWGNNGGEYPGVTNEVIYNASGAIVHTFTSSQLFPWIYPSIPTFIPGGFVYSAYGSYPNLPGNEIYSLTTGTLTFQGPPNPERMGAAGASAIVYEADNGVVYVEPFQ
jgi:hypothetical protein